MRQRDLIRPSLRISEASTRLLSDEFLVSQPQILHIRSNYKIQVPRDDRTLVYPQPCRTVLPQYKTLLPHT